MKALLFFFLTFSASAETIRVSLLSKPCVPSCAKEIEEMFSTHYAFRKVAVLPRHKEIYLEANDWMQDAEIKRMLKSKGVMVLKIRRMPD